MQNPLLEQRRQKDQFFKTHPQSPLSPGQQQLFQGLSYYDPNPDLDLTVTATVFDQKEEVQVQTTTGEMRWYRRYGEFSFLVGEEMARLTIYQTPHGFFLPFVDSGAGTETYPAGRYLEPEHLGENRFHIDFNAAYNPFCAYSPAWSCPITPAENRLKVPLHAGEKMPQGKWTELAE